MKRIAKTALPGLFFGLSWLSGPLLAQISRDSEWRYRVEVFGEAAHGGFYNGSHSWGSGADFGGGIGVRPFSGRLRGLGFEMRTARLASEGGSAAAPVKLRSLLAAADAVYHFRSGSRVQPYVLGGVGVVNASYYRSCKGCVFNVDSATGKMKPVLAVDDVHATKAGITLGAGLKIAVHRRVSLRPEVLFVDTTPGSGWNWGWVRVQMGVGYHF